MKTYRVRTIETVVDRRAYEYLVDAETPEQASELVYEGHVTIADGPAPIGQPTVENDEIE